MSKEAEFITGSKMDRVRSGCSIIGLGVFACGLFMRRYLELSDNQDLLSRKAIIYGLVIAGTPLISEYQDSRKKARADRDRDDDDDGNEGDWPPDDNPEPDVPDDPGGLAIEWTNEVESYANEGRLTSV